MKRWIHASEVVDEMTECAKYIQRRMKSTKVPFDVPFDDGSTLQVKFNCSIKKKANYCFVAVTFNLAVYNDDANDFKQRVISDAVADAKEAYPDLNIYPGHNTVDGPRGYSDYGIYVNR